MSDVPCFIGIDVAKAQLDIAVRPSGVRWAVPNDPSGVTTLVDQLQALHPTLIVLEATGGLERAVTGALATAGLPVVVVNPRQVRDFARATGQLAKTDALDARALAHFADVIRPTPRPAAGRPDAGAARPLGAPPATDRHADRGTEPPGGDEQAPDAGHRGPYCLAQCAHRHAGRRPGDDAPGQPAVARKRRPVTECPGHWARCVPGRCCWNSPSWGRSRGSRSRPWSAWRPSIATVGPCGAGAPFGEVARMCAPCCTWARSWRHGLIRRSKPFINGFSPQGKSKKSL